MKGFWGKMKCILLVLTLCTGCIIACGQEKKADILKTTFIKCGKADMIILESAGKTMIIDTGENDDGDKLAAYLNEEGIRSVDILIITHFDKDHIGGAPELLEKFPVKTVYMPDYEGDSKTYDLFMRSLEENGYMETDGKDNSADSGQVIRLRDQVSFSVGDMSVTVDPPSSYRITDPEEEYDNDFSLITDVEYGDSSLLFMGDAEDARLLDYMDRKPEGGCDLIKMPHHGRYHEPLEDLISSIQPSYAVITDSEKHPAEPETEELLAESGVQIYHTADGNVEAVSDGKTLTVTMPDAA